MPNRTLWSSSGIASIAGAACSVLAILPAATAAPAPPAITRASCGLVGTWRFIEVVDWDSAGHALKFYGAHPNGRLIYSSTGQMSVYLAGETRAPGDSMPSHEFSYFGTYSTDAACRTVTHHVTGGNVPEYTGTHQARRFTLKGDTLVLGDGKTWRRTLVRVKAH